MYFIFPKSFDFVCVFFPVFCFFTACSLFLLKLHFYLKKLLFLSPNSMNTSSFSCFISKSFVFCLYPSWCGFDVFRFPSPSSSTFSFFTSIYLHLYVFFLFFVLHCMFIVTSKATIFSSKKLWFLGYDATKYWFFFSALYICGWVLFFLCIWCFFCSVFILFC